MLPVTRANLDHICCICLLDIRPSVFTDKVYDVKKENNLSAVLKLTAHITILRNPINEKYINDYCRNICEVCYVKAQYSYFFREKIMASTAALKELLESSDLSEQDIERFQYFCRICLNRQESIKNFKTLQMIHLHWLKDCTGIRFTSLIDLETFRIKEGTNLTEIAVINDKDFPKQLCLNCFKKLQNVEEFRKSATQSFGYMISVMGDICGIEDDLMKKRLNQMNENVIWREVSQEQPVLNSNNSAKQECIHNENDSYINKYQMEINFCDLETVMSSNILNTQQLNDCLENVIELANDLPHMSDSSDKEDSNNEFSNCFIDSTKSKCLRISRNKTTHQCELGNLSSLNSEKGHSGTTKAFKSKPRRCKNSKKLKEAYSMKKCVKENESSQTRKIENMKSDTAQETHICNVCSKVFLTRHACKRHYRNVHNTDSTRKLHECLICSKTFKRKGHLIDHVKTVHEKLRPFKCSYCEKTFSAHSSKRVHELTHTENSHPFTCKFCGKAFRQSSQLKIHTEIHTTNPDLLCPICKRSQKTENDLQNHLKSHSDKRLQCSLCGKFFTKTCHLKDHHNAVHLKLRPFKCKFCDLAFGDRKTAKSHEKIHTEDRPIICSVCNSGFKTLFSLRRHINQFGHTTDISENSTKSKRENFANLASLQNKDNVTIYEYS